MEYSFDNWGWLSQEYIPGRTTEVVPPEHAEKIEGELYPNFTGYEWILSEYHYYPDPVPPTPDPILKSILTPLEFLNRFTNEEASTIIGLSKTDPNVELWWVKYNKAQDIDLDDPQTIEGVNMLEQVSVLLPGRAAEILTKYPI